MTSAHERCNEAIAALEPLHEQGFALARSATEESVLLAFHGFGIRAVPVDGILQAESPAEYARGFFGEGKRHA